MGVDPTIFAGPLFIGSMVAENRWLEARPDDHRLDPGRYERGDATANITLALGSVIVPLAFAPLRRQLEWGRGRLAKPLAAVAVGAAAAATIADRVARRREARRRANRPERPIDLREREPVSVRPVRVDDPELDTIERLERFAGASAVTAVGAGALVLAGTLQAKTMPERLWPHRRRDLGNGVLAWTLGIVGYDLIYYWNHRLMHTSRWLWAIHVPHHSSERYNLSVALRQAVLDPIGFWVPGGLLSWLGVRPRIVELSRTINLIYQFWVHTEAIDRMGPAESVMNTPSHHRVHHGVDRRYIDRNHGGILILWDRLFGTFTPEEEHPRYGITTPLRTNNLGRIVSHEFVDIARDVANSRTWSDRLGFVVRGPGWAMRRRRELAEADAGLAA